MNVYLIKVTIGIFVLYGAYKTLLSPLTFFSWRRYYLIAGCVLVYLLPLIYWPSVKLDVGSLSRLPAVPLSNGTVTGVNGSAQAFSMLPFILVVYCVGAVVRSAIIMGRYVSLIKLKRGATKIDNHKAAHVYQLDQSIPPFAFGNSIFIHTSSYASGNLEQIVEHEYAHVSQFHTADLIMSELFCILNWFNPFAWLLRREIKENLEYSADHAVLSSGFDRRSYQYLLLELSTTLPATFGHHFSISSLKKRIIMINRPRSGAINRARFLVPVFAMSVLVMAFSIEKKSVNSFKSDRVELLSADTTPQGQSTHQASQKPTDEVTLSVADDDGETIVIVKNKKQEIVKAITLEDWKSNADKFERKYGVLPDKSLKSADRTPEKIIFRPYNRDTTKPLVVLDGTKIQADTFSLNSIDPNSIERVDVLKGPLATEKYGDRGKHGVVEVYRKISDSSTH